MKFFWIFVLLFTSVCSAVAGEDTEKTWEEVKVYLNASEDPQHQIKPFTTPISAGYFAWKCRLVYKNNSRYLCWDYQVAPFPRHTQTVEQIKEHLEKTTKYYGFIFGQVRYSNANLPEHTHLIVIGRYTTNATVSLKNGDRQLVPVLSDVYVFKDSECNTYDCETHQQDPLLFQSQTYQQVIEKKFPVPGQILKPQN